MGREIGRRGRASGCPSGLSVARRRREAVSGSAWVGDWGCVSFKSYPFTARGGPAKTGLGTDEALEGDEFQAFGLWLQSRLCLSATYCFQKKEFLSQGH